MLKLLYKATIGARMLYIFQNFHEKIEIVNVQITGGWGYSNYYGNLSKLIIEIIW